MRSGREVMWDLDVDEVIGLVGWARWVGWV